MYLLTRSIWKANLQVYDIVWQFQFWRPVVRIRKIYARRPRPGLTTQELSDAPVTDTCNKDNVSGVANNHQVSHIRSRHRLKRPLAIQHVGRVVLPRKCIWKCIVNSSVHKLVALDLVVGKLLIRDFLDFAKNLLNFIRCSRMRAVRTQPKWIYQG